MAIIIIDIHESRLRKIHVFLLCEATNTRYLTNIMRAQNVQHMRKHREACLFLTCTSRPQSRKFKDVLFSGTKVQTITAVQNATFLFIFPFVFLSRVIILSYKYGEQFYQFFLAFSKLPFFNFTRLTVKLQISPSLLQIY